MRPARTAVCGAVGQRHATGIRLTLLQALSEIQGALLRAASAAVRPGGQYVRNLRT